MEHILPHFKEGRCLYCHQGVASWDSEWGDQDMHHYKAVQCGGCGKKNWVLVGFPGSGHDSAMEKKPSKLESAVDKLAARRKF